MSQPDGACSNCRLPTRSKYGVCTRGTCEAARSRGIFHLDPEYTRAARRASHVRHPGTARAARDRKKDWLKSLKIGRSCVDCGLECAERNYPAFDWDHRPGVTKEFNVASARDRAKAKILAEIAKCDLRCGNCHRIVTFSRRRHGEPESGKVAA